MAALHHPTTPDPQGPPPPPPKPQTPRIIVDPYGYTGPRYELHQHCYSANQPGAPIPPPDPSNPPNPVGPKVSAR